MAADAHELQAGDKAPDFYLADKDSNVVPLIDFRGRWVVLYFYPKDDTPGCTLEGIEFTKLIGEFRKLNAEVIGISPDSPESHCSFIEKHSLGITLLSDRELDTCQAYGVWRLKNMYGKEYHGVHRSTFIIAPDGIIAYLWYGAKAEGHAGEVMKKLQELQG
jgi:thioredoxin-dependent peroxiredoxin